MSKSNKGQNRLDFDPRTRIAAALYSRAMSRLAWHRSWDDLQSEVQQMWLEDADAVIRELPELQPSKSNYADHFCPGGCDCSCCYGYDDSSCHCLRNLCNCGGDRAAHGQKPLEEK